MIDEHTIVTADEAFAATREMARRGGHIRRRIGRRGPVRGAGAGGAGRARQLRAAGRRRRLEVSFDRHLGDGGRPLSRVFELPRRYAEEIIAQAREEAPNECCGILAGEGGQALKLYRAVNAEHSPYRFDVDARDLYRIHSEVESLGWRFVAIYHSHPQTEAYPSATDVAMAACPGQTARSKGGRTPCISSSPWPIPISLKSGRFA